MATTTNYAWETPDDTDLVKDGASAIRTLGSSIDTTTKALNPSTTLGDIEYRSATANTNTRLGIGSTGDVLTVAGGVPTWAASAGGSANWTLLNSGGTALTAAQTITVSGISAKDKIMIFVTGASSVNSAARIRVRLNTDTASNYYAYGFKMVMESVYASQEVSKGYTLNDDSFVLAQMATSATSQVHGSLELSGCNSSGVKIMKMTGGATGGGGNTQENHSAFGYYNSSSAITSISINSESGNFDNGTVFVYTSA